MEGQLKPQPKPGFAVEAGPDEVNGEKNGARSREGKSERGGGVVRLLSLLFGRLSALLCCAVLQETESSPV